MRGSVTRAMFFYPAGACFLFFALALSDFSAAATPQQQNVASQKNNAKSSARQVLVLKDGTSENCSSYEVQGDHVRYYSLDRGEWEEIPTYLVDWVATKKAQAAAQVANKAFDQKLETEEAQSTMMPVDVDASLEVAPGIFLPPGEGAFILDGRSIFPLKQSEASSKLSKGRMVEQVLVPIPIIPSRHTVDLKGAHAAFRISDRQPEFYVRTSEPVEPDVELIAAKVHGDKRQIANLDTLFTQQQEKRKTISLQEWKVANGVYRFTLGQPLAPGEYALVEFSSREGMNLFVWDFGVDRANGAGPGRKK